MTQYGVEGAKRSFFVESGGRARATGQPQSYCAVTMLREDDLDEAKETAETSGELLSCEDA